jgi:hypothetical protein
MVVLCGGPDVREGLREVLVVVGGVFPYGLKFRGGVKVEVGVGVPCGCCGCCGCEE